MLQNFTKNFQKTCNKHLTTNDNHDIVENKTQHTTTKMLLDTIISLPAHVEQQHVTRLTSVVVPGQSRINFPTLQAHAIKASPARDSHRSDSYHRRLKADGGDLGDMPGLDVKQITTVRHATIET